MIFLDHILFPDVNLKASKFHPFQKDILMLLTYFMHIIYAYYN